MSKTRKNLKNFIHLGAYTKKIKYFRWVNVNKSQKFKVSKWIKMMNVKYLNKVPTKS